MIARVRTGGLTITCDWTQAEGDVCACGHHRQEHEPFATSLACGVQGGTGCLVVGSGGDPCACSAFNGIGSGGDAQLTDADRRKYAQADLDGVLQADIVWLLAANDKGACGSWVELGGSLVAKQLRAGTLEQGRPVTVVSGPKWKRTIFTELADYHFDTDEAALAHVLSLSST